MLYLWFNVLRMYLKRFFTLFLLSCSLTGLKAQNIDFFQGNMDEAKSLARKQHKLIYVLMEMGSANSPTVSPAQNEAELRSLYKSNFICVFDNFNNRTGFQSLYDGYDVNKYPAHLFLDEEGGLLLKTVGFRSARQPYIDDINKAKALAKGETLTKFKQKYDKGERGLTFLKDYLSKYNELDIPVDQLLLDQYINLLPVGALSEFETVVFLMELGPVVSTKAYKASRWNERLTDSVYRTLSLERRVKMNNRTIKYTMSQAVRNRDEKLAVLAANFASGTWNDWQKAANVRSSKMMEYYKAVNDTANYLKNAADYYQSYYISLRDSIQKPESRQEFLTTLPKRALSRMDSVNTGKGVRGIRITGSVSSISGGDFKMDVKTQKQATAREFANNLNNGAYSFYSMGSTNPVHLAKAVVWVQRSIELFPEISGYYDTLSHLYYQQGKFDEAVDIQQKAIDVHQEVERKFAEMRSKANIPTPQPSLTNYSARALEQLMTELNKMKLRKL